MGSRQRSQVRQGHSMTRSPFGRALVLASLCFLVKKDLSAQQLATLSVTVTDASGAGIPQARVSLKNTATGARRSDFSNREGLSSSPLVCLWVAMN